MTDIYLFVFAALAVLATPGPTNTLLATSGAARGFRGSLSLVPAELCGYLTAVLIIGLVIGPVFWNRPFLSGTLRVASAAYLIFVAYLLWRDGVDANTRRAVTPLNVLVTTLLNPKAAIFALVIIPMQTAGWPRYLALFAALIVTMSLGWIAIGNLLTRGPMRWTDYRFIARTGAVVIAGFAVFVSWPVVRLIGVAG
jgi:threonine/homoserine/homoserine lactone efflux protein